MGSAKCCIFSDVSLGIHFIPVIIILCILLYISDVALQIVKSERWKEALRNITDNNGVVDTPLRKLIRKMPG